MECTDLFDSTATSSLLLESHRADLYHFTNMHALERILWTDELRRGAYRGPFISLTRNARWWGWNSDFTIRITLDGAGLYALVARQGLRIGPVEERRFAPGHNRATSRGNIAEREERIFGEVLKNVRSVTRVIDAKRHRDEYAWLDEEHDLSNVALLAPLQRSYGIAINYEKQPLVSFAKRHLSFYLDCGNQRFQGGPFRSIGPKPAQRMQDVAREMFETLRA